ncbi:MAG: endonuclease domain-containing protein [Actinomycetota bacterium]
MPSVLVAAMREYRVPARREEILDRFRALKARQFGLFERDQARHLGMSDDAIYREVASGRAIRAYPRVYRDAASPQRWEQDLFAALLWAGKEAAASHRAAAALWSLDGSEPSVIELTVPSSRKSPNGVVAHKGSLGPGEVTNVSSMRVTSPTRTILDLAAVIDEAALEIALDSALRRGLTSLSYLQRKHEERSARGRRGTGVVSRLLRERTPCERAPESPLETKFVRLLREARLPAPHAGHEVGPYRLDFAYPSIKLGIELDGYAFHSSKAAWQRDHKRHNELVALGWTLLRFTWDDVAKRRNQVAREIRRRILPTFSL